MNNLMEPKVILPPQPTGMKHRFHAMVKPVGSLCNLDCTYCYYLHKEGLLHQPRAPRMSDEVLERHIRQYIEAQTGDEVVFSWQGGEPTLLCLDFSEARYKKPHQRIENDLQTNGLLLDAEWAIGHAGNSALRAEGKGEERVGKERLTRISRWQI